MSGVWVVFAALATAFAVGRAAPLLLSRFIPIPEQPALPPSHGGNNAALRSTLGRLINALTPSVAFVAAICGVIYVAYSLAAVHLRSIRPEFSSLSSTSVPSSSGVGKLDLGFSPHRNMSLPVKSDSPSQGFTVVIPDRQVEAVEMPQNVSSGDVGKILAGQEKIMGELRNYRASEAQIASLRVTLNSIESKQSTFSAALSRLQNDPRSRLQSADFTTISSSLFATVDKGFTSSYLSPSEAHDYTSLIDFSSRYGRKPWDASDIWWSTTARSSLPSTINLPWTLSDEYSQGRILSYAARKLCDDGKTSSARDLTGYMRTLDFESSQALVQSGLPSGCVASGGVQR